MPNPCKYPASTLVRVKEKWYVNQTVPADLRVNLGGQKQLRRSTGTSDKAEASRRQHDITSKLYKVFDSAKPNPLLPLADILEMDVGELEDHIEDETLDGIIAGLVHTPPTGSCLEDDLAIQSINKQGAKALEKWEDYKTRCDGTVSSTTTSSVIVLSTASQLYLDSKPYAKYKTSKEAETALKEFVDFAGDLPLPSVTKSMAYDYAEHVGITKSKSTVGKKTSYARNMMAHHVRKGNLSSNPFSQMSIPKSIGTPKRRYEPFTPDELNRIFQQSMPDHVRSLLTILVTTGMRLDEAALLNWEDVKDEGGVRHFDLTHRDKTIKNIGSSRKVPVPSALVMGSGSGQVFPEFKRDRDGKAQGAASKACMNVIRKVTTDRGKVTHSLRHSFKDLMRDAEVTKEVQDFITGHSSGDVAGSYGTGPSLAKRKEAIDKVKHPWLKQTC